MSREAEYLLPLLTLGVIVALELANRQWTILELAVLSPMVAATFAGPRLTAVYGVAAVATGTALGLHDELFSPRDGGLIAQLVRLAGVAVGGAMAVLASQHNTRRERKLRNVSRVAEVAQRAILADVPALSGGHALAFRYESAAAEAMVGGDLYEVIETRWGTRLLVGDVRGKGLDAVRIASRVLGCFRVMARRAQRLGTIVDDLDMEVADIGGLDDFVTCVLIELRGDHLQLVNAGHPDPMVLHAGAARLLEPAVRRPPLGLGAASSGARAVDDGRGGGGDLPADGDRAGMTNARLEPGDRLLLYTDGIAEARHPRTRAFFPLLPTVLATLGARATPLDEALSDVVTAVRNWTGGELRDDVALLAVEIPPVEIPPVEIPDVETPAVAVGTDHPRGRLPSDRPLPARRSRHALAARRTSAAPTTSRAQPSPAAQPFPAAQPSPAARSAAAADPAAAPASAHTRGGDRS